MLTETVNVEYVTMSLVLYRMPHYGKEGATQRGVLVAYFLYESDDESSCNAVPYSLRRVTFLQR